MRRIFAIFAVFAVCASAMAQSLSIVYDFKSRAITPCSAVASYRLADDLFGLKWFDVDVVGLVGATARENGPTLGTVLGALAIQPRLGDDRLYGQIGIAGRMEAGRPVASGLLFGISWKF